MSRTSKLVMFLLLSTAVAAAAWNFSKATTVQAFGEIVPRVDTEDKIVALTFDDGPTKAALDEILPALQEKGVKATFFLIGSELERRPDLGRRLAADGHELGNHSYSHKRMVFKTPSFVAEELLRTDQLIRAAGHSGAIHFRPPYGTKFMVLPYVLDREKRKAIMWDVEPDSYVDAAASSAGIVKHVVSRVRPGSIIILHVMYPSRITSREAVPSIVDELQSRGYRFVTASELLRSRQGNQ